jgi:hypothetical protein
VGPGIQALRSCAYAAGTNGGWRPCPDAAQGRHALARHRPFVQDGRAALATVRAIVLAKMYWERAMTAAIMFLMVWAALAIAGNTPFGRMLHHIIVDIPARIASRISRANVAITFVIVVLVVLHLSAGEADPVRLLGLFAPDLAVWLIGLEISAFIEVAASIAGLAAWCWINVKSAVAAFMARFWKRPDIRTKQPRRRRRDRPSPANDDEDGGALALALAS